MSEFELQISRELGNIQARLKNIEEDIHDIKQNVKGLYIKVYSISGGIAVFGVIAGLILRKLI